MLYQLSYTPTALPLRAGLRAMNNTPGDCLPTGARGSSPKPGRLAADSRSRKAAISHDDFK